MRLWSFRGRGLASALLVGAALVAAPVLAQDPGISSQAAEQIRQLLEEKKLRTPAQQKMSSALVYAIKEQRLEPLGASIAALPTTKASAGMDANGNVAVTLFGTVSPGLETAIKALGGVIVHVSTRYQAYEVSKIPLTSLELLADRSEVRRIDVALKPTTNRIEAPGARPGSVVRLGPRPDTQRLGQLLGRVSPILEPRQRLTTPVYEFASLGLIRLPVSMALYTGLLVSQGIVSHGARTAVTNGYRGTGIKVGVLSDSASAARIAALQASGDLPPGARTSVLPGQAGPGLGSDEGTAMMEIVYDMAPGVDLIFATAFSGQTSFADNIRALQAAGCSVIVDDVTYFNEGVYQDGFIAQGVNDVTAAGAIYFSSAGNSGSLTMGTSGTWEGDFNPLGPAPPPLSGYGTIHSFGAQTYNVLTAVGGPIFLKWSDPLGGSVNDYDLFALNSAGTAIIAASTGRQTGTQDPVEYFASPAVGSRIAIVLYSGAARALHLSTNRGRLSIPTSGAVYGHNGGEQTMSTAAVYWNSARVGTVPFTGGPANPNESFSADGVRRIFYEPNGTPITPGNFLIGYNGGRLLIKPDIAAADGVFTLTPGFKPFYGTSAAAPHAAAIAALVRAARPGLTVAQVKQVMRATALDNMQAGIDRNSGYGIVMAMPAINAALLLP